MYLADEKKVGGRFFLEWHICRTTHRPLLLEKLSLHLDTSFCLPIHVFLILSPSIFLFLYSWFVHYYNAILHRTRQQPSMLEENWWDLFCAHGFVSIFTRFSQDLLQFCESLVSHWWKVLENIDQTFLCVRITELFAWKILCDFFIWVLLGVR